MNRPQQPFTVEVRVIPSEILIEHAQEVGVSGEQLMQDYVAIETEGSLAVAVGDMANNLTGTTYRDKALAIESGLPADYEFNGGLVGSLALRKALQGFRESSKIIPYANTVLANLYHRYGMGDGSVVPPEERFTGYLTHARLGTAATILTAVGDVNAWVNGSHVLGAEKAVDIEKYTLVTELTKNLESDGELIEVYMQNIIHSFAQKASLGEETAISLYRRLRDALTQTESPDRQTMHHTVRDIVTRWQIRTLQNQSPETHHWAYGAIDGTETPDDFVKTYQIPTADIDSLVIATDGSMPRAPEANVLSADDLMVVNSRYSEQTIVALSRA